MVPNHSSTGLKQFLNRTEPTQPFNIPNLKSIRKGVKKGDWNNFWVVKRQDNSADEPENKWHRVQEKIRKQIIFYMS